MTITHATSSLHTSSPRWLLLASLAVNLFFIGVAVALLVRAPAKPTYDRNVFVRIDRLAATLPPSDGAKMRAEIAAHHDSVAAAQTNYRAAQDAIRATLRQEPFDENAMRAAMVRTRAARQNFDQAIQSVVALAAAEMSPAGRRALADWPPDRKK
ncbi:MAG TPA: periplasmic heavy metal sensor [Pseudolabrys sp.]|nr:periplasmic heavy metal sensor [Pseudolabrys sp.]